MSAFLKGTLDRYEGPILPAMTSFLDFDAFGVLPRAGGVRDQEPSLLDDLRLCVNLKRQHDEEARKALATGKHEEN